MSVFIIPVSLINIESYGTWLQTKIRIFAFFVSACTTCLAKGALQSRLLEVLSEPLFEPPWTMSMQVFNPPTSPLHDWGSLTTCPAWTGPLSIGPRIESLHFYKTKLFRYSRTTVQQNSRIWIVLPFDDEVRFFPGKMKVSWKFVTLVLQTNDQNDRRTA